MNFFLELRQAGVPVTLREYLTLLESTEAGLANCETEHFYYLSRAALVKDERNFDRFDRVFGHCFKGLELTIEELFGEIPEEWLRKLAEKTLTEEERALTEALGGWDKLMETLRERLVEQKGRHQAATSGSGPLARRPSVPTATIRKEFGSAASRARAAPSRSGSGASTRTWTTPSSSGPAISRSRSAGCAALRVRARRPSSICRPPYGRSPTTAGWIFRWSPSGEIP